MRNNFSMGLMQRYFNDSIKHKKLIEFRLNDIKRQKINIGDYICFYNQEKKEEKFNAKVTELVYAKSFNELVSGSSNQYLNYSEINKKKLIEDLDSIYLIEDINKYGVVGIKFEIENSNSKNI